jgi:UDP-N-acetylglucosamine diphosphorylase / glucose-1-phosphate thymidylyltransferase / UDP-N-acetylgalactosamine diphosphorylase / glucosamine-1-phosphate N-acetyltransferase / galactosamine-1-phosphate N-acetyltransferase
VTENTEQKLWGLIPAAGRGTRAIPYTENRHKGLLDVNGTPNIERIIAIMRDDMAITDIVIVIGHLGETIRHYLGDGSRLGVRLHYVENSELDKGLAWSILLARKFIPGHFCIMLCDECYISSNHRELLDFCRDEALFTCAGLKVDDAALIRKNYAVIQQDGVLLKLVEKPEVVPNDIMGSGTFICSPSIFGKIEKAFAATPAHVDFVTLLNDLLTAGERGYFFQLTGTYVNINDRDSLALARYHDRDLHFSESRKVLLVYAEGDEDGIVFTIERYRETGVFDEIIAVLPVESLLASRVREAGAQAVICPPGCIFYGEKLLYALRQADADIIALTEADYSFSSRDVQKLFAYLRDADMVIGTRTTRQLIEQGSTMRGLVRLAHAALGKLMELLWWDREARFTDAGCTFRAFWRSTFDAIEPALSARGPEFSAEMMIACLDARLRVIEIPVNYFNRSASQIRAYRNPQTFWSFLCLILKRRFTKVERNSRQ